MKFIHVSDVHLGIKPDEGKPWSEKRAQDIWDSFAEVIGAAVELKPDFLLISGDLFHAQPLKKELREVNYLFSRTAICLKIQCRNSLVERIKMAD